MDEGLKQHRRFQFKIHHLLILTASVAAGMSYVLYQRPDQPLLAVTGAAVGIGAGAIVGVACLFPERYGRWIRPMAVIIGGLLSLAFGLWVRKYL
jgi:hypothetical protein